METRVVIRDNKTEKSVEMNVDLPRGDIRFLNEIGERIAQETGFEIVIVAVEKRP